MIGLGDFVKISERRDDPIDDQWINNEKPVMTKDGRQVIVTSVDYSTVPNKILGQVKMDDKLFEYEWQDNGTCTKAVDRYGNPKKADDGDMLVKAI